MEMIELKPCPRCGNGVFIGMSNSVWCRTDNCLRLPSRSTETEAIAAWNTRTPEPRPANGEMCEKVARAIASARSWQTKLLTVGDWDDRSAKEREPFLALAHAAITAYDPNERLREALEECRERFSEYEREHQRKAQMDGQYAYERDARLEKADRNREMVVMIDAALSHKE